MSSSVYTVLFYDFYEMELFKYERLKHIQMKVTEIKGFHILPVTVGNEKALHYIFFKKHDNKGGTEDTRDQNNRTIFFYNLPICTTMATVKKYFQDVAIGATVESFTNSYLTDNAEDVWIDLSKLTTDLELDSGLVAKSRDDAGSRLPKNCGLVTFVDKAAFQLVFSSLKKLSSKQTPSNWPLSNDFGSAYFLKKYNEQILDPEKLSTFVSQSLVDFERAEKESMEELQKQTQLVDEDGFTMVVGSHRKTKAGILGRQKLASTVEVDKAKNSLKKKERDDFYKFQIRERKKNEMNELLRKFKEDQERIKHMKDKKKFRPY